MMTNQPPTERLDAPETWLARFNELNGIENRNSNQDASFFMVLDEIKDSLLTLHRDRIVERVSKKKIEDVEGNWYDGALHPGDVRYNRTIDDILLIIKEDHI